MPLSGKKIHSLITVATITTIVLLTLITTHIYANSFYYLLNFNRFKNGTTIFINAIEVQIPAECYIFSENIDNTLYTLSCKNDHRDFLSINIRNTTKERISNLRINLSAYPYAELDHEYLYFAWKREGDSALRVIDHFIILPSIPVSISGDDRDIVLQIARSLIGNQFTINPAVFDIQ